MPSHVYTTGSQDLAGSVVMVLRCSISIQLARAIAQSLAFGLCLPDGCFLKIRVPFAPRNYEDPEYYEDPPARTRVLDKHPNSCKSSRLKADGRGKDVFLKGVQGFRTRCSGFQAEIIKVRRLENQSLRGAPGPATSP